MTKKDDERIVLMAQDAAREAQDAANAALEAWEEDRDNEDLRRNVRETGEEAQLARAWAMCRQILTEASNKAAWEAQVAANEALEAWEEDRDNEDLRRTVRETGEAAQLARALAWGAKF